MNRLINSENFSYDPRPRIVGPGPGGGIAEFGIFAKRYNAYPSVFDFFSLGSSGIYGAGRGWLNRAVPNAYIYTTSIYGKDIAHGMNNTSRQRGEINVWDMGRDSLFATGDDQNFLAQTNNVYNAAYPDPYGPLANAPQTLLYTTGIPSLNNAYVTVQTAGANRYFEPFGGGDDGFEFILNRPSSGTSDHAVSSDKKVIFKQGRTVYVEATGPGRVYGGGPPLNEETFFTDPIIEYENPRLAYDGSVFAITYFIPPTSSSTPYHYSIFVGEMSPYTLSNIRAVSLQLPMPPGASAPRGPFVAVEGNDGRDARQIAVMASFVDSAGNQNVLFWRKRSGPDGQLATADDPPDTMFFLPLNLPDGVSDFTYKGGGTTAPGIFAFSGTLQNIHLLPGIFTGRFCN